MRNLVLSVFLLAAVAGCSPSDPVAPDTKGIPSDQGRLEGRLGGPPQGTAPTVTLRFTMGSLRVTTAAKDGAYQVDLDPGVWDVRSTDGKVCATGLQVKAGARQRADLLYPVDGCQNLAPPLGPASPPPPAKP